MLGPKPLSSCLLLNQVGDLSVLRLQHPGQQQVPPSYLDALLACSLLGETEARSRVEAGSAWQRCLPRRRPGKVPRQGWGFVNCSSVLRPQAGWVKGGWLLPTRFPANVGSNNGPLCPAWVCCQGASPGPVPQPRLPRGYGGGGQGGLRGQDSQADREPASLSLPHRGSPSPERAL